jgi:hypothetical protein
LQTSINLFDEKPQSQGQNIMNLKDIVADPSISHWLKDAIRTAYDRDPVEAIHDARWLLKMLGERYAQVVNRGLAHSNQREITLVNS